MKNALILISLFLIFPIYSSAATWEDPYFDEAVNQAGLICMGEVVKSTPKETSIRITKLYKGDRKVGQNATILRAPIVGHGYEDDVLTEGETFFFMVKPHEKEFQAFTDTFWYFPVDDSLIVVPIRDPLLYFTADLGKFEQFLGYLIKRKPQKKIDQFVDHSLTEMVATNPLTKSRDDVQLQVFSLEILYHFGKEKHAEGIIKFLESPYFHVRWSCIRALSTCGGPISEAAILEQLEAEEINKVQSAIGKAIFKMNIAAAKPILEAQIPAVSWLPCPLASDIMNPVMNFLPAPRYAYGAALMRLNGEEGSYDELVAGARNYIRNSTTIKLDFLEDKKTYYSIEKAMENPDSVYILVLGRKGGSILPPEVENFKNLRSLKLYKNDIKELPAYLANLNLTILELSDNDLDSIPAVIFQCKSLEKLNLKSNKLTTLDPRLFNLTKLEEINLNNNDIAEIPSDINKLANLKTLGFRMNQLDSLPKEIGQLKQLEYIELYGNDFVYFPEALLAATALKTIKLGSNSIKRLPLEVTEMENLTFIDLSRNPLTLKVQQEIADFPPGLIVDSEVYSGRLYSVYEAVEHINEAKIIHDYHNNYSNFELNLSVLTETEILFLSDDKLTHFPEGIVELTKLKTLNLSDNAITEIPEKINQLINLKRLDLSGNQLKTLPPSIGELKLKYLYLKNNQFTDSEKEKIESWFSDDCTIFW